MPTHARSIGSTLMTWCPTPVKCPSPWPSRSSRRPLHSARAPAEEPSPCPPSCAPAKGDRRDGHDRAAGDFSPCRWATSVAGASAGRASSVGRASLPRTAHRRAERPIRPTRPSAEDPVAPAKKFTGQPARLSIRVDEETLRSVHKAAVNDDETVKRFVLLALREKGVTIGATDLVDDGDH